MTGCLGRLYAVSAGVAFVASLAYGAYFYLHALDRPGPAPTSGALWHNVAWTLVFALHHSLMARSGAKQALARIASPTIERATYVWIASLLYVGVCAAWRRLPGELYAFTGPAAWPFVVIQLGGAAAAWLGVSRLDPLELSGIRQTWSARRADPKRVNSPLHTDGIYAWVRHPLYLGWVLMVWGTPHMTMDRLVFATLTTAYLVVAVPFEERSLAASFGEPYLAYRRRVRWRIVPFLY